MAQDLAHLRKGDAILKPVHRHQDGTFGPPAYVKPARFTVVEGLLGYHLPEMLDCYDVRVYLNPPEEIRRQWKVQRDCSRRGYTTDQVLAELDRREPDSEAFIRPQRRHADIVVSFVRGDSQDPDHLDAHVMLGPGLPHPDLTSVVPSCTARSRSRSCGCSSSTTSSRRRPPWRSAERGAATRGSAGTTGPPGERPVCPGRRGEVDAHLAAARSPSHRPEQQIIAGGAVGDEQHFGFTHRTSFVSIVTMSLRVGVSPSRDARHIEIPASQIELRLWVPGSL